MSNQDALGVWQNLGTVTPKFDEWVKFPSQCYDSNSSIRLTFSIPNINQLRSYAWFRAIYEVAGLTVVQPAIRIYPKSDILILQIPVIEDFKERNNPFRSFQVMKKLYRTRLGNNIDNNWSVTLEELWG